VRSGRIWGISRYLSCSYAISSGAVQWVTQELLVSSLPTEVVIRYEDSQVEGGDTSYTEIVVHHCQDGQYLLEELGAKW
jgi:hypothetical protein